MESNILRVAVFVEKCIGKIIARFMLGMAYIIDDELHSTIHKTTFNTIRLWNFLKNNINICNSLLFIDENKASIMLVTEGANIWIDCSMHCFKELYLFQYADLPTSTHYTKRAVKEDGYYSTNFCPKEISSVYNIAHAGILPEAYVNVN